MLSDGVGQMLASNQQKGKIMSQQFNIDQAKNYARLSNGHVFTGEQVLRLLEIAPPHTQAVILLDIVLTEKEPTLPDSKYGVSVEQSYVIRL
jgi:hypothetical protein